MKEKKSQIIVHTGLVVCSYNNKTLLEDGNDYYIIRGANKKDEKIDFEPETAVLMPSFMFAMAAMQEEDFTQTLQFIKKNWFGGMNN